MLSPTDQVVQVMDNGEDDEYSSLEIPKMLVIIWDDNKVKSATYETDKKKWGCFIPTLECKESAFSYLEELWCLHQEVFT